MNDLICFIKLLNEVKWLLKDIWQKKEFSFQMVDDVAFFLTITISMASCVVAPLRVLGWRPGLTAVQSTTRVRPEGKRKRIRKVPCSQGSSCWKGWGARITRTSCGTQLPLRNLLRNRITGLLPSWVCYFSSLPPLPPATVDTPSCIQTHSFFSFFFFILFYHALLHHLAFWHSFITPQRKKSTLKLFTVFTELFMAFDSVPERLWAKVYSSGINTGVLMFPQKNILPSQWRSASIGRDFWQVGKKLSCLLYHRGLVVAFHMPPFILVSLDRQRYLVPQQNQTRLLWRGQ